MGIQADRVKDLLVERLEAYYAGRSVSAGSSLYETVVAPVAEYLGTDPIDTDIAEFLKTRLRQEYPSVSAEDGDAIVDLLINPLSLLLEALKREVSLVKLGQSVNNAATMREEDADALAANFFVTRRSGNFAYGVVRVYYSNPVQVYIPTTVRFSTSSGLNFRPSSAQTFSAATLLLQRSGNYYYVDVQVVAETQGQSYNIPAGSLTSVTSLTGYTKFTNLFAFSGGTARETNVELLSRVRTSLTERSLNTRRGIVTRIQTQFPTIRSVEVVGYGDPEMQRDVITGTSDGHVVAAGTCFIVGQFCLLLSQFEDRGRSGTTKIKVGDVVALNYWNLLYNLPQNERNEEFTVREIVFDSRETLPDIPSILLFRLSEPPSPDSSTLGMLPGMLPGVFCVVRSDSRITISDIPGGIQQPTDTNNTIEVLDNQVHIGGHYDVWVRDSIDQSNTAYFADLSSVTTEVEGRHLITHGADSTDRNVVNVAYAVSFTEGFTSTSTIFTPGTAVVGEDSGATATVATAAIISTTGTVTLTGLSGRFLVGERILNSAGTAGGTITYVSSDLESLGVTPGMVISVLTGADVGAYRILEVDGENVYLDTDLTESEEGLHFQVLSSATVDLFQPKNRLLPFADALCNDLFTSVGSAKVRVGIDVQQFGVEVNDTLRILSGNDAGIYTIAGFDPTMGGQAPILNSTMSATNSNLEYEIYRTSTGVQRPFVRIKPGGVRLLDSSSQDSGIVVPYALPLGAYSLGDFSGAKELAIGRNAFVLPDPGTEWTPSGDLTASRDEFPEALACYSDECLPCDGYIAVVTLMANGQFYLNSNMPVAVTEFFRNMQNWLLNVVDQFNIGADAKAFVHGLTPITFGAPVDAIEFESTQGTFRTGETLTTSGGVSTTISDIEQELVVADASLFTDGETVIQFDGTASEMGATVQITSPTTLRLTNITGPGAQSFEVDPSATIVGQTSGAAALITGVRGRFTVSGTTGGALATGDVVTSSATTVDATVTTLVEPLLQFEICLPGEMFDGCNNVLVALPEFDWEALLATTDTFAEAVSKYTTGQLISAPPALSLAKPGDVVSLLAGANEGQYSIHAVHKYRVGTAYSIVEGTADISKFYPVTAVVIDGEFPVELFGDLASFFADGIPDLASLPVPGDFDGYAAVTESVSGLPVTTGVSPWEWIGQFLSWLFRFLDSMGFDLPETFKLDPAKTLRALWQMLFTEYRVGRRTADQKIRLYFQEPTSVTVFGPRPCKRLTYDDPTLTAAVLTLAYTPASPGTDAEEFVVEVRDNYERVRGVFTAAPDDLTKTASELAALMQEQIDADAEFVVITGDSSNLIFTSVRTGNDISLLVDKTDFAAAGVVPELSDGAAFGTSTAGTVVTEIHSPAAPTLFSVPVGAEQLLFTASADLPPVRLFPSEQEADNGGGPPNLYRDCRIPTEYTGATALRLSFTEQEGESWFYRGLTQGDLFQLHEQKFMLLKTAEDATPDVVFERLPALITTAGSSTVRLPSVTAPEFTFVTPPIWEDTDTFDSNDVVQVGDLLYIEEGDDAGVYRISSRLSATELVLDRALTASSGTVFMSGNACQTDPATAAQVVVSDASGTLGSSYIGKYLTVWGSNFLSTSGSYEITAITAVSGGYQITLADAEFLHAEMGLHWAIVRAPTTAPAASELGNATEFVGVRPFRIYSGRPKEWPVISVERSLDAAACSVLVSIADPPTSNGMEDHAEAVARAPRVGFRQPCGFVRNSSQHISSTTMATQKEAAYFYFDVVAHSLDSQDLNNISRGTRLEPVFGTYTADGYFFSTANTRHTFSSQEQTEVTFSNSLLPIGRDDAVENRLLLLGRRLLVEYEYSSATVQVQQLLNSSADRILCANPLARAFMPSYISMSVGATVANSIEADASLAEEAIQQYITGLPPTSILRLSAIESVLASYSIKNYPHPLYLYAVAHDLDRRLVLTRSEDSIGTVIDHNGSNRTTCYVPGPVGSGVKEYGEHIKVAVDSPTS
jgi:hypothetical protein